MEPSSSPDATASVEPSELPDPTASVEPSSSPDATASVEPSESPDPTASVEPSESPAPEIPDGAEAWMTVGDAVAFGTLAEMIEAAQPGAEIALRAETPMFVEKAPLRKLSQLKFKIDEQVFSGAEFRVACSEDDPMQVEAPQELDMAQFALAEEDDALDLYFWVVRVDPAATSTPAPTTEPGGEIALAVESENYVADAWTNVPPTFHLSGMPGEGRGATPWWSTTSASPCCRATNTRPSRRASTRCASRFWTPWATSPTPPNRTSSGSTARRPPSSRRWTRP